MAKNDGDETLDKLFSELNKEIGDFSAAELQEKQEQRQKQLESKYKLSSFPTKMKCTQAFDELVECYSLGGQLRNIYRYGEMSNCQEQRKKAKFCIFNKLNSEEVQQERVAKFYMEKLARQKLEKGSSEDIWSVRKQRVDHPFAEEE